MQKLIIETDPGKKGFLITCPLYLNNMVRGCPSRRFSKASQVWKVPGTRMNAAYLLGLLDNATTSRMIECGPVAMDSLRACKVGKVAHTIPFPPAYKYKTKPYGLQVEALNAAWGKDCFAFFMEMGTGKSKVYSDLAAALYMEKEIDAVVVLTKYTLRKNILREFEKHANVDRIHTLTPRFDTKGGVKEAADFCLLGYAGLKVLSIGLESLSSKEGGGKAYEYAADFLNCNRCLAVVDESHLIKGHRSIRTRNAITLGELAKFRAIGTGTEILKGVLDLYSQFEFLDPDILGAGDFYSFRNHYAEMGGYENKQVVGYKNIDELTDLVRPWVYQALKKDHLDLPEKVYMEPVFVELTREQQRVYNEVRKEKLALIKTAGGDVELVCQNILSAYLALQQVCAGFVTYAKEDSKERALQWVVEPNKNPKFKEVVDLLQEYPDRQFIIWSRHVPEIKALTDHLRAQGISARAYFGGMSDEERQGVEDDFKAGRVRAFVSNPASAGTGLTFVNCHDVIYISNDFNLGNRLQSEDRTHRIGQKNEVNYHEIVAAKSVETLVLDNIRGKVDLANFVREKIRGGSAIEDIM